MEISEKAQPVEASEMKTASSDMCARGVSGSGSK